MGEMWVDSFWIDVTLFLFYRCHHFFGSFSLTIHYSVVITFPDVTCQMGMNVTPPPLYTVI